jgi:hypothetical protein
MSSRLIVATLDPGDSSNSWVASVPVIALFDDDGHMLRMMYSGWPHGFSPVDVAIDSAGRIIAVGYRIGRFAFGGTLWVTPDRANLRAYTRSGSLMLDIEPGGVKFTGVAVDASNNIYVTGAPNVANNTTHKYSPSGALLWSGDSGERGGYLARRRTGKIKIDSAGRAIVTSNRPDPSLPARALGRVTQFAADGSVNWTFDLPFGHEDFVIDASDNIYVAQAWVDVEDFSDPNSPIINDGRLLKLNASGALVHDVQCTMADAHLHLFDDLIHVFPTDNIESLYRQYDFDLNLVYSEQYWPLRPNAFTTAPADPPHPRRYYYPTLVYFNSTLGYVDAVACKEDPSTYSDRFAHHTFQDEWASDPIAGSSDIVRTTGNMRIAIRNDIDMPPLALPLALRAPTWEGDRYAEPPGLPLPLALGVPRWLLEPMVAGAAQTLYRLRIDGDPILYLQPSFFSIRRGTTEAATLNVTCPNPSAAALAVLNEREGAVMRLQTGFRQGDHPVQFVDHLTVILDTARSDTGPRSSAVSLTGRAAEVIVSSRRRQVYGLSYRRSTAAGAQTWRVIPDAYLDPGDTALYGSEELTVAQITVSVGTTQATMELSEVPDA